MSQTITIIYENGTLRPLQPLPLPEHTQLQIAITLPETSPNSAAEQRRNLQLVLIAAGVIAGKSYDRAAHPLTARERALLADKLALNKAEPLSDVIIEEHEGR